MDAMRPSSTKGPRRELAERAAVRYGVFTRADALACGISPTMLKTGLASGVWERMHTGIFRPAGTPLTPQQRLMGALLRGGPASAASHRSAAAVWAVDGFALGVPEISTPRNVRSDRDMIVHRVTGFPICDVATKDGFSVTEPCRTLIDLASVVSHNRLEDALDDMLRRRLVTIPRLRWRLSHADIRGKRGTAAFGPLLRERVGGATHSRFERMLLRALLDAGLPRPVPQYTIHDGNEIVARVDLAYPQWMIAIEADSYRYHSSRAAWERDLQRRNRLQSIGWTVLHGTWRQLHEQRDHLIELVRDAIRSCGGSLF